MRTIEEKIPKVGDNVTYYDSKSQSHNALVSAVWGPQCINLLYVSLDESKTDQYGRQIERQTSNMHGSKVQAHGNYWRFPDEEPNTYSPPLER